MDLYDVIMTIGERPITLLEVMMAVGVFAVVVLFAILIVVWRAGSRSHEDVVGAQRRATELELRLSELAGQLKNFSDSTATREAHLARNLEDRLDKVSHRLGTGLTDNAERTTKSLQHLYERLAVIDTAQQKITSLSDEMLSLKDILANKQTRGAYGQARMESIIRDGLHQSAYRFQATLSNNTRPDCLIRLPENDQEIVIDSKFPLEAFNALKTAETEQEIVAAQRRLRKDVLYHVKDIAKKYLIAGETHETAIMFLPSESIYADLHEHFEDVIQKAHRQHVILASPNILMLLVQTMQAIFKDARMREQASLIQKEVVFLLDDVGRLKARLGKLQSHFQSANKDIDDLVISTGKITKRGEKIEQMELAEEPAPALADEQTKENENPAKPKLVAG
jgi:DNA recombination protein RmuC